MKNNLIKYNNNNNSGDELENFNYRLKNEKFFLVNDKIIKEISKSLDILANNDNLTLKYKKEIIELQNNLKWYKFSDLFETKRTMFSQISFY